MPSSFAVNPWNVLLRRQDCVSIQLPSFRGFTIIKSITRDAGPVRKLTSVDCPQYFPFCPGTAWLTQVNSSSELSVPFTRSMVS